MKTAVALTLSCAAALAACTDDPVVPAATCAELAAADPGAVDAEHTLYLDHNPDRPWRAYCHGMSTPAPAEYLTLARTDDTNFSELVVTAAVVDESDGEARTVRSSYQRIRFDPTRMAIDTSDRRFATDSGVAQMDGQSVTGVPFGVAAAGSAGDNSLHRIVARGGIDLAGTGFVLADDDGFCRDDDEVPMSTVTVAVASDRGRVDLRAELSVGAVDGESVSAAPRPCPIDPWLPDRGGLVLALVPAPAPPPALP